MNAVGKTLVILNFLFAIVVGIFLVFVMAQRNQLREKYIALEQAARLQIGIDATSKDSLGKVLGDYGDTQRKLEADRQAFEKRDQDAKAARDALVADIEVLKGKLEEKDVVLKIASKLNDRNAIEIAHLNETIEKRQKTITELEGERNKLRGIAANYEQMYQDIKLRNDALLDQLQEKSRELTKVRAGVGSDGMTVRKPNEPNPPPVKVEGKITKVDGNLIQLSLGTDDGVKEDHTLTVFRLQPQATFLGTVRIIDAYHHTSVARLVPSTSSLRPPQLKEGDVVSSKIK
jgi:hypothetical protein